MTKHRVRRGLLLIVALVSTASLGGTAGAAWPAMPASQPSGAADHLDLAAMALDVGDLPEDLRYFEYHDYYYRADWIAAQYAGTPTDPEEVLATGLRWLYDSSYRSSSGHPWIRSYILEFGSPEEAATGFAFFEDEETWAAAFAADSDLRDLPESHDVGEEPREITVGTAKPPVCCDWQTVDVTFRVGRLLAGVAIDAPDYADAPDRALALDLAGRLEERVRSVLDGEVPAGIDPAIRDLVLPITAIWTAQGVIADGYLTVDEGLGPLKPLVGFREDYQGGYTRTMTPDAPTGSPGIRLLFITVAVIKLDNPLVAETVLKLNEFLPRPAPLQLHQWEPAAAPAVPGADAEAALAGPTWADAYQVAVVVDRYLARVWVEGTDDSQAIALDLAAQQVACLAAGGPCERVVPPDALATAAT